MSETASERLARLLALVPWLRAHDGITIEQAAAHFGVSEEQLTTDLWQLIVCGIPGYGPDQLVDIQFWDDDRIHVLDPVALEQPLRLTPEEVSALHMGLRVLAQVPGSHDVRAIVTAMAKLESAGTPPIPMDIGAPEDPEIVAILHAAMAEDQRVEIDYAPGDRDRVETRRIAPHASYTVDGVVYLQAWCERAEDIRTFRLDRVHAARPVSRDSTDGSDSQEVSRPESRAEDRSARAPLGRPAPAGLATALVRIAPQAAWVVDTEPVTVVEAAISPPGGDPSDQDANTITATIDYASSDWLVRWVLGFGGAITVLEPAEIRQAVVEAARQRRMAG